MGSPRLQGRTKAKLAEKLVDLAYAEKWLLGGTVIGLISGMVVIAFYELLRHVVALGARFLGLPSALEATDLATVVIHGADPARLAILVIAGAAVSGVIVYRLAPEAEGHGTDAAVAAFHKRAALIPFRVPVIKLVASGIAIGTGSSGGVEGPSVQMGAGVGSALARLFRMPLQDRRISLVAGIAGALSAMFRAPLGSAFFAVEVLYKRDLEAQALMPSFVSSLVSYAVTAPYFHYHEPIPRLDVPAEAIYSPSGLVSLLGLGFFVAPFALAYVFSFTRAKRFFDDLVEKRGIPLELKPVLGAVAASAVIVACPIVAGSGKGLLAITIAGRVDEYLPLQDVLPLALVLLLAALAKIVATSFSIGSGASGGVFAPALLSGALVGLSYYHLLGGQAPLPPSVYAYVGMAAFFGAAAKVPLAVSVMVGEMGHNYFLIAPTLAVAHLARELTGEASIYESQIRTRPPRGVVDAEALLAMLRQTGEEPDITLAELVDTSIRPVRVDDPLEKALEALLHAGGKPVPVVDSRGILVGVLEPDEIETIVEEIGGDLRAPLAAVRLKRPPVLGPYSTIEEALEEMVSMATDYVVVAEKGRYIGMVFLEEINVALSYLVAHHMHHHRRARG